MTPTTRLYYDDPALAAFSARVLERSPDGLSVYLDQSAFYPSSGGQLHDLGTLAGIAVTDVVDEDTRVLHRLAAPLPPDLETVEGAIDWPRRFDFMQQHSGQHLLSAIFAEEFGLETVSVHLGLETSTLDLAAAALPAETLRAAFARANQAVWENLPVTVSYEDAATAQGLRKPTGRTGLIRIVSIEGLDRSACGGTHVRQTGEIGPLIPGKLDKMRGNTRVEFTCGARALAALEARTAQLTAQLAAQTEAVRETGKRTQRLLAELAEFRARELHAAAPVAGGLRRVRLDAPIDEEARTLAQAFTALGGAALLIVSTDPAAVLLAASADAGLHCGNLLKPLLAAHGGRGGGAATLAQGSLPNAAAAATVAAALGFAP